MKKLQNFVLVSLCLIVISCSGNKKKGINQTLKSSQNHINFDIKKDIFWEVIDLNSLIDSIEYIPLETNEKCMISDIFQVHSDTGNYFIHDRMNNNLFLFDLNGTFVRKIGTLGKGPNEYLEIYDVALDKKNKIISIMDLKGRKYLLYSYAGEFKRSVKMDVIGEQHEYCTSGIIYNIFKCHNPENLDFNNYCLAQTKKDAGLNLYIKIDINNNFTTKLPLRKFNNRIFFNIPYRNSIVEISDSSVEEIISINFNEINSNNHQNLYEMTDEELGEFTKNNAFFNGEYLITEGLWYLRFYYQQSVCDYYYSKTGSTIFGSSYNTSGTSESDSLKLALYRPPIWLRYDQKFISMVEPFTLIDKIEKIETEKLSNDEIILLQNLKVDNNPILLVYNFQNF